MKTIEIQDLEDEYVIRIEKNVIDKAYLSRILERLELEYLIKKAAFDERLIALGEEMKQDWWENNRDRILKKMEVYEPTSDSGHK